MTTEGVHVSTVADERGCVYWHRELPPVDAEVMGEHVLEATRRRAAACRVRSLIVTNCGIRCYGELMQNTRVRLHQEITRLGGHYADVLDESINSKHDDASGDKWLHGRFTYVLYGRSP